MISRLARYFYAAYHRPIMYLLYSTTQTHVVVSRISLHPEGARTEISG